MKRVHPLVIGISPFSHPDPVLVRGLCRAGAMGVLDLGNNPQAAREALEKLKEFDGPFGVRITEGEAWDASRLPSGVTTLVAPAGVPLEPARNHTLLVQVTTLEEARSALAFGAGGLIAKGAESGGRIGAETSFILLQRLLEVLDCPIWVQGGIGVHTAAACVAAGAAGVVLDSQLALLPDCALPESIRDAVRRMDGSETVVVDGYRVYSHPGLTITDAAAGGEGIAARLGATTSGETLLPTGQDAAFASSFLARFGTAAGVVRGLSREINDHLRQAKALKPLAPGGPLARFHGTRFPIAQGPMTQVSDGAAFAVAVSEAGGLPFLALALMRGAQVRKLVTEVATRIGDRPWGVGILGFVPEALREEQLAVLQEVRPPVALVSGGRPSQARALEAIGISTYLHAPSPGLLDLFLKEGIRQFVFEGWECGGHVGPRSSFTLWDAQIERMLAFDSPGELSVFFAGGIHDARSAAMVAAMAAPLAAKGAKIGVLMGTAYLFTREAVETGAIVPVFQQMALHCERTALLETSPGHASRCADTDYVGVFAREKERLLHEGRRSEEVWAALEQLNVGRLRIAAKGLRRSGNGSASTELVSVGADSQQREGMYMIGQLAGLRHQTTNIIELHREVSEASSVLLGDLEEEAQRERRPSAEDGRVAIIGLACVFPGARNKDQFWANIVAGINSVTEVSPERWSTAIYYDPESTGGEKTPSKWGGFIGEVPFDPLEYGIAPKSLGSIDPVQLLSLEVAAQALKDAGYEDSWFDRGQTSVIFGAESGTELTSGYGFRALYPQYVGALPKPLDEHLPSLTEDSFPGVLSNVIAGRIANRLDLGGVNYTVDAACASSLAAVDLGIKELVTGTSHMVLCGGADLHNSINDYLLFSSVHALSHRGQCRTFDSAADGIVLGEGVAVVVMKRLADALHDGDRIYAVIEGIGGSSDGKCLGLTAPRRDGQVSALARAYQRSGISPAQVALLEAHGTGTVVGDGTELETLTEVFGQAGAAPGSVTLGSVKSQIGHTKCAAGMAGLIKAALAIHHRVLPPTLNIEEPHPSYSADDSPFVLSNYSRPWLTDPERPARAAVSSFGFGGTNFHAVLAECVEHSPAAQHEWPAELFAFRGNSAQEACSRIGKLSEWVKGEGSWRMRDLARTVASQGEGPVQVAVVATDQTDLARKLDLAMRLEAHPDGVFLHEGVGGDVAFLFPGQGSQRPGMMVDLFNAFPGLRRHLEMGQRWVERIYPPSRYDSQGKQAQQRALTDTRVAQPALGMVECAAAELLGRLGVRPQMMAGHSYGELVAVCLAGAFDEEALLALSEARGECIVQAAADDPGAMAGVSGDIDTVREALADIAGVVIANHNSPQQVVISGSSPAIDSAVTELGSRGISARPIPVACAFHSPLIKDAAAALAKRLEAIEFFDLNTAVWSNTTAEPYPRGAAAIRRLLAEHVVKPVRFVEQIESMYAAGARIFVEVGPGQILSGLVGKILSGRPHLTVPCDDPQRPGLQPLVLALGKLAAAQVSLDLEALFEGRECRVLDLMDSLIPGRSASTWMVNGHRSRPLKGELPAQAMRPVTTPPATPLTQPVSSDTVVLEYLRGVRELVASQRDVMLSYLGGSPIAATPQSRTVLQDEVPPQVQEVAVEANSPVGPANLKDMLLQIVSERTGYPVEMLDLDLDLEAALSIDSIKRLEILGSIGERLGFSGGESDRDDVIEKLANVKTLGGILAKLQAHASIGNAGEGTATRPTDDGSEPAGSAQRRPAKVPEEVHRYLLSVGEAPAVQLNGCSVSGRTFAITDDGLGVAERLAHLLKERDASAQIMGPDESPADVDGLIHLAPLRLRPRSDAVEQFFSFTRDALMGGAAWVVGVTGFGGTFGRDANGADYSPLGGESGLLKSAALEWPEVAVRTVDVDPREPPEQLARHILDEILAADRLREVGYTQASRTMAKLVPASLNRGDSHLTLGPESVVLLTGGARGITAVVAEALVERFGCQVELVGRSPLPADTEDRELAAAGDAVSIRKILIGRNGAKDPAVIESECSRILAAREIRENLEAIRSRGAEARYHSADVRDAATFGGLIDDIYARRGRLDGVIHGAGIIEDRLLRDKTLESFQRVFTTKVSGALTLTEKLRQDVGFVVFFSSVSGTFGNAGQTDYAAANDALDKIAFRLSRKLSGRVVSIAWGPWAGAGMISPELERQYSSRGIGLIRPDDGAHALIDELLYGSRDDVRVILTGMNPDNFVD